MPDAVVIGSGPNGLVAANLLADAGWAVEVFEAQSEPGGAVRSDRAVHPDYVTDIFSAFYPLAAASPVLSRLDLGRDGLRWVHAPHVLAHPLLDGRCAVLDRDRDVTAGSLDEFAPGDGEAWMGLCHMWDRIGNDLLSSLFSPFPPLRAAGVLAWRLRAAGGLRLARSMLLPVRRFGEEEFAGQGGRLLLAGNALHADFAPEAAGSGGFGWLMSMLGQSYGFPVPAGGSSALTSALVRRLSARGAAVHCGQRVTEVVVRRGRAVGVRTAQGGAITARKAVLADVSAPALYQDLVGAEHLPPRIFDDLRRFQWDFATFKVDWALDGPVPWSAQGPGSAGTVHLAEGVDELTRFAAQIAMGRIPDRPFTLVGQMTTSDATRSPLGTESAWAYTHVPHSVKGDAGADDLTGRWDSREQEAMADRIEGHIERYAPGFRNKIISRRILAPPALHQADSNLYDGAINGGTANLHQQLVFRPVPGMGRPETPVPGLYLASASAHPGGGVHGAPGANAAHAALHATRGSAAILAALQRSLARHGRSGGNVLGPGNGDRADP
ncbi:phytoene desaturase family protein [Streptomyces sp. NRRL B-24720]|uniref:phytoene desaturase family protein n=1 Tax=Streptomyces sp. NRRL B-24720 TaxID=1476876 RepID=UPI00099DA782|nr:NAD(P)/FAD-dependent oxidoreductase [Streptomyces sp. NRRL B-24720]